ncbi:MAG TPA: TraR/DksA C4-type zinc finger protein [Streptosporangiaceae bacterium]
MPPEQRTGPAVARTFPGGSGARYWRVLLEARWQVRLQEVTELSLAYHGASQHDAQHALRRAVAARRKLADIEEALGRLTAGTFGACEECGSAIPPGLLNVSPEARYCPPCAAGPVPARQPAAAGHSSG